MLKSNTLVKATQFAAGQYVVQRAGFVSTEMLTGKVLRFNPGFYFGGDLQAPSGTAFQIVYNASPDTYEMTIVNCKNHKAFIKIIDAFNFEIEFRFFATKNLGGYIPDVPHINSTAFDVSELTGTLSLHVRVGSDSAVARIPIQILPFCTDVIDFEIIGNTGFIPGKDIELAFKTKGTVSNNYFAGIIKMDSISNNADIIPGLVNNYGKIGSGVSQWFDLPADCLKQGNGFMQVGQDSTANLLLDGACLQSGSTYKVYVVYYKNSKWQSCISDEINQSFDREPILPLVEYLITDDFGAETTSGCVRGLSNHVPVNICFTLDIADMNQIISDYGYSGTFDDYLVGVKAFATKSINAASGTPLTVTDNNPEYCINGFLSEEKQVFVILQITMQYPGHKDVINIVADLQYDVIRQNITANVQDENGLVSEICEGTEYLLLNDIGECLILQSVDGSEYVESNVLDGQVINVDQLPVDSEVCIKAVCGNYSENPEEDCGCPPCPPTMPFTLRIRTCERTAIPDNDLIWQLIIENYEGTITSGQWDWYELENPNNPNSGPKNPPNTGVLGTFSGNEINEIYSSGLFEGLLNCQAIGLSIGFQLIDSNGNTYQFSKLYTSIVGFCGSCDTTYIEEAELVECADCDCPEEPEPCMNYAGLIVDCDEETQTIEISVQTNFSSSPEMEELLCSEDGITFIECPESITGVSSLFITYDAKFTDGCPSIHLEQVVDCNLLVENANSREITLGQDENMLTIEIDTTFSSTAIQDLLYISIDGGKTFTVIDLLEDVYGDDIELSYDSQVVVYTNTIFEDGFVDLQVTQTFIPDFQCDFNLDITEETNRYLADTDANTPDYLWEIENDGGRITIGTSEEVPKNINGILWLTVTSGDCSKTVYKFIPKKTKVVCVLNRCNGTEFIVTEINLLDVSNPMDDLYVTVNGVDQTFVSGTPSGPNQFGIKEDGKLLVFGTLTNATIKIVWNP